MKNEANGHWDDEPYRPERAGQGVSDGGPLEQLTRIPRFDELEAQAAEPSTPYMGDYPPNRWFAQSINPLVTAAAPLFGALAAVDSGMQEEGVDELKACLCEHLYGFEAHALNAGVESAQVMTARYVLCTAADEAVVTSEWNAAGEWSAISLLSTFHNETFGGEKCFQLLDQLQRNPVKNLHLLELMYICLSLGFQGKYRLSPRGASDIESLRGSVYRQIRHLRGEVPKALCAPIERSAQPLGRLVRVVPGWAVAVFTAVSLLVVYVGFAQVLDAKREAVLRPYQLNDPALTPPAADQESS